MNVHEAIKERIVFLCNQRGWSVNELIKRSNINQSTISEIMSGRSKYPRINTLKKISNGFGITLSEFFDDDIFINVKDE